MRIFLLAAALTLAGCVSLRDDIQSALRDQPSVELTETPFFPQEQYQCGPAALATLLTANGVAVSPDQLTPNVYTPGRRGSLQQDLIGATRAAGLLPYRIDPTLDALLDALQAGRPVLVLQNLGVGWWPQWHYAVVVGYDPAAKTLILRSGTDKRRQTRMKTFLNTWARSDFWGIVALQPNQVPAGVDRARYFRSIAAIESIGETRTALRFWTGASTRWPEDPVPMLGQGNAYLALGDFDRALSLFEALLASGHFRSVATNNLAYTKAQLGRFDEALGLLNRELVAPQDPDLETTLRETRREIQMLRQSKQAVEQR